ncbi:MAG: hypothetical protein JETT_3908 [Candidatus Jettenia ecosi]|uniref:Carboxypeptidase regulatory-like domain-containing protein n=1 Tax=Candidatus Jettenia ecosi TaxID=2494326 RepID=A0A533QB53_9BACT|nr:MAG: hypothetical protein JETT_3908 [Candidatus Jettenia ecosi]
MKIIQHGFSMFIVTLAAIVSVVGCAQSNSADLKTRGINMEAGKGRLSGKVTRGPISPVEREGVSSEEPASGIKLVILNQEGQEIGSVVTDDEGKYSAILPPGSYRIEMPAGDRTKDLPAAVIVAENEETHLDIRIDTGLR